MRKSIICFCLCLTTGVAVFSNTNLYAQEDKKLQEAFEQLRNYFKWELKENNLSIQPPSDEQCEELNNWDNTKAFSDYTMSTHRGSHTSTVGGTARNRLFIRIEKKDLLEFSVSYDKNRGSFELKQDSDSLSFTIKATRTDGVKNYFLYWQGKDEPLCFIYKKGNEVKSVDGDTFTQLLFNNPEVAKEFTNKAEFDKWYKEKQKDEK